MKIAIDAMGGDFAPENIVEGAVLAAKEFAVSPILVGDRVSIEGQLEKYDTSNLPIRIVHASEVIGMNESPAQAIRKKKDSSIRVCFDIARRGDAEAVVSAGNSGAVMAAAVFVMKKLKGIDRPAIMVCLPTPDGSTVLLDAGGNVDCKPENLFQFAVMGSVYAEGVMHKSEPKIGMLSNGAEDGKGNELTRETDVLLKKSTLNYIGYVEGRDVFSNEVDVAVCDGFVGNVLLKSSEGIAEAILEMLKREIMNNLQARLGYMLAKGVLRDFRRRIDYTEYGGAPLIGVNGICIIGHGGSTGKAVKNAIGRAMEYRDSQVNNRLEETLSLQLPLIL